MWRTFGDTALEHISTTVRRAFAKSSNSLSMQMPYYELLHLSIQMALYKYFERTFHILFVGVYLFIFEINHRSLCEAKTLFSIYRKVFSHTVFFFPSVPLFLHSSFVLFLFCFLPFSLHSFVPSSFLLPSFLPSFLTLFLPYFVLVLASLGFTPLSLASLGSAVLDFTRLHSAQFGFARLFRPFLLGCVVRLLFYRTTICTSHVAMSSPAVLCRAA